MYYFYKYYFYSILQSKAAIIVDQKFSLSRKFLEKRCLFLSVLVICVMQLPHLNEVT